MSTDIPDLNLPAFEQRAGEIIHTAHSQKDGLRVVLREHIGGFSRTTFRVNEEARPPERRYTAIDHVETLGGVGLYAVQLLQRALRALDDEDFEQLRDDIRNYLEMVS